MSSSIEHAIRRQHWKRARSLIRAALRQQPDSHWLHARLALTYYEEHDYVRALSIGRHACKLAPRCPLVLWEVAGSLEMLGHYRDASAIYRRLIRRGCEAVAFGDCGEGLAWARGLIADCWYRLAGCQGKMRRRASAIRCYEQHLRLRGPGCRSIYPIREVRNELRGLRVTP